ncbi:hypothetical protein WUBG_04671, partial [Wuchereria bancrofti]
EKHVLESMMSKTVLMNGINGCSLIAVLTADHPDFPKPSEKHSTNLKQQPPLPHPPLPCTSHRPVFTTKAAGIKGALNEIMGISQSVTICNILKGRVNDIPNVFQRKLYFYIECQLRKVAGIENI